MANDAVISNARWLLQMGNSPVMISTKKKAVSMTRRVMRRASRENPPSLPISGDRVKGR